jgi:hypothetical protein
MRAVDSAARALPRPDFLQWRSTEVQQALRGIGVPTMAIPSDILNRIIRREPDERPA